MCEVVPSSPAQKVSAPSTGGRPGRRSAFCRNSRGSAAAASRTSAGEWSFAWNCRYASLFWRKKAAGVTFVRSGCVRRGGSLSCRPSSYHQNVLVALSSTTGSSGSSSARRAGVQRASAGQRATGEPARITGRRAAETRRTTSEAASPVAFVMFCNCAQNGRRGIGELSGTASAPIPATTAARAKT